MANAKIRELLGAEADALLTYEAKGFSKDDLHLPGPDFIDRVVSQSDRSPMVLRNFQNIFNHGRLAGTGYVSILPVDQGIEHSAGASFAPNASGVKPGYCSWRSSCDSQSDLNPRWRCQAIS